jgi:hypothetical protein
LCPDTPTTGDNSSIYRPVALIAYNIAPLPRKTALETYCIPLSPPRLICILTTTIAQGQGHHLFQPDLDSRAYAGSQLKLPQLLIPKHAANVEIQLIPRPSYCAFAEFQGSRAAPRKGTDRLFQHGFVKGILLIIPIAPLPRNPIL